MKFLETISTTGDPTLIPIDRIKCIKFSYNPGCSIKITSDESYFEECFDNDRDKAKKRYELIRNMIED